MLMTHIRHEMGDCEPPTCPYCPDPPRRARAWTFAERYLDNKLWLPTAQPRRALDEADR